MLLHNKYYLMICCVYILQQIWYSVEFCVSDIRQMSRMVQFSAHVLA